MIKQLWTAAIAMTGMLGVAQDRVPARMTVTVEAAHGKQVPELKREDVRVFQGKDRLALTEWTALQGEQSGLELFIMIDDASAMSLGSQLADLRQFIHSQPASTLIGVAYMSHGAATVVEGVTADHAKAAAALRLPVGGVAAGASPYLALDDLIKKWAACCVRQEVLIISSGIDPLGGMGPTNPYLDVAIGHAQRAGIIVYAIYNPQAGHGGHSFWRMNWGQNHLAQLTEESGGEAYMLGFGPLVSFAPYLRDVTEHLADQYAAGFLAKPLAKPGLASIRFATEVPDAEIVAASKVYIAPPAPPTGDR